MPEEEKIENVEIAENLAVAEVPESEAEEVAEATDAAETEIRDTDIVFDCPHCGHNLAIDYRGAGLQITCVNCGESVLVPIPDGMKIDDLDIEPGEILKQLFAARRNLQKCERRIEELQSDLEHMTIRRDTLQAMLEFCKRQIGELKNASRKQVDLHEKMSAQLDRMASDLETDMADEEAFGVEEGGEDGASDT